MKKSQQDITFSLLNFNTHYAPFLGKHTSKRIHQLAKQINHMKPSILCLQEVHTYLDFLQLKKSLNGYPYSYYKKLIHGPKGGLVIFSKLPMGSVSFIDFSHRGSIRNKSIIARLIRNGVLVCKLKDVPLFILNVYLTPNLDHSWEEGNRYNKFLISQLIEIAHLINVLSKNKQDAIIAGDFNVDKNSYIFKNFLHITHVDDVFSNYVSPTYHQIYLKNGKEAKRIDFMLLSNRHHHIKISEQKQVFTEKHELGGGIEDYLSDHIGLLANLSFSF